jgi:dolichol-phosphate mannosyltransferase
MYNEEAVLPLLVERLRPVLDGMDTTYEVVAVDDGSFDATPLVLAGLARLWPELRVVRLRRNSGHQAALAAGLYAAFGQYIVSLDADLQDPPEVIPQMLALAKAEGLDIVSGIRSDRSTDTAFKRWTAGLYYRMMRRLVGRSVPAQAGDFRLLSRATVEALRALPEPAPVFRLLVPWIGFPNGEVSYVREHRAAGRTKYPLSKMIRLAADSVISFSAAPLRLATLFGLVGFVVCVVLVLTGLVAYISGAVVPGWTSLFLAILFIGATQLLCLGLVGEYVARIFAAVQGRPAYFIAHDSAEREYLPVDDAVAPDIRAVDPLADQVQLADQVKLADQVQLADQAELADQASS